MNLIETLFGSNKSADFLNSTPKLSLRKLGSILIKIFILVIFLPMLLGRLIMLIGINSYSKNELTQSLVFMFLFYSSMIIFSYKYFYSSFAKLRVHLTSLRFADVLKHAIILIVTIAILSYIINVIGFIFNPSDIEEALNIFKESSSQNTNYAEIIIFPLLVTLVGFGEEMLFRAGIYRTLRKNSSMIISSISASLFFILLHPIHITKYIVIYMISICYCYYFEYKNNLLTIIIAHTIQNLVIAGIVLFSSAYTANFILNISNR